MSAHEILIAVMAIFAVLGAIDRILGNQFGIGQEFENGILAMGSLALAMVGIIALAPVLAQILQPIVVPVYQFFGADPAMFAGTILACDMGGGALAMEMTQDPQAALLGGVITGSMLGATIVFTIPVAMGILREEDRPAMAKGILCGIITIPIGVLAGGLVAGFPVRLVVSNLIPIIVIGVLIALGLWKAEKAMIKGFGWFGKGVVAVITVGLAATTESLRQKDRAGNNHKTVFVCTSHFRAAEVYQRFYFILFFLRRKPKCSLWKNSQTLMTLSIRLYGQRPVFGCLSVLVSL